MNRWLAKWIVNTLALWAAAILIPGISYGNLLSLIVVALLFGIVNTFIKPVVKLFSLPFIILTLGLFTLVINALLLWLTAGLAVGLGVQFYVHGFWAAFWGAIIVSIVSLILSIFVPED